MIKTLYPQSEQDRIYIEQQIISCHNIKDYRMDYSVYLEVDGYRFGARIQSMSLDTHSKMQDLPHDKQEKFKEYLKGTLHLLVDELNQLPKK